ncbi:hypothetical protein [Actinacidiphila oryziradicis]|uniref:Uncharacterized protein n=1 Tax=Actinacidiphila oryziradicis TaxID=2571141 RepID=A0A4U0SPH6_9ACTN|nr:hypothetical protein [Actinacidiphila oryziradicis]TKA11756.1 hypothetical protein FCI23_10525 [Actinacidiphila oryziradicis]
MSAAEGTGWPEGVPPVGALVRDTRKNCDAVVMAAIGTYVQLRPVKGGTEWDAKPKDIRALTAREELSARMSVRNTAMQLRVGGQ